MVPGERRGRSLEEAALACTPGVCRGCCPPSVFVDPLFQRPSAPQPACGPNAQSWESNGLTVADVCRPGFLELCCPTSCDGCVRSCARDRYMGVHPKPCTLTRPPHPFHVQEVTKQDTHLNRAAVEGGDSTVFFEAASSTLGEAVLDSGSVIGRSQLCFILLTRELLERPMNGIKWDPFSMMPFG